MLLFLELVLRLHFWWVFKFCFSSADFSSIELLKTRNFLSFVDFLWLFLCCLKYLQVKNYQSSCKTSPAGIGRRFPGFTLRLYLVNNTIKASKDFFSFQPFVGLRASSGFRGGKRNFYGFSLSPSGTMIYRYPQLNPAFHSPLMPLMALIDFFSLLFFVPHSNSLLRNYFFLVFVFVLVVLNNFMGNNALWYEKTDFY